MDETSSGQYYHNPSASFLPNSLNYNNNVFQTLFCCTCDQIPTGLGHRVLDLDSLLRFFPDIL